MATIKARLHIGVHLLTHAVGIASMWTLGTVAGQLIAGAAITLAPISVPAMVVGLCVGICTSPVYTIIIK